MATVWIWQHSVLLPSFHVSFLFFFFLILFPLPDETRIISVTLLCFFLMWKLKCFAWLNKIKCLCLDFFFNKWHLLRTIVIASVCYLTNWHPFRAASHCGPEQTGATLLSRELCGTPRSRDCWRVFGFKRHNESQEVRWLIRIVTFFIVTFILCLIYLSLYIEITIIQQGFIKN